jgi:hypothetical protein
LSYTPQKKCRLYLAASMMKKLWTTQVAKALGKLQTLLRETRAGSRSLTSLELGVRLADHVNRSFAFHDLAIGVTALGGGK